MIRIRNVENPLKFCKSEIKEFPYSRRKSLEDYLKESGFEYSGRRIIVSGKIAEDLSRPVQNEDEIIIIPEVKAPVVAAVSYIVTSIAAFAAAQPLLFAFYVLSIGYSIYQYLNQPKMPDFNLGSNGLDEGSPTYSWEGVQTMQEVGVPIAVVYGEHRIGGNVVNQYLWEDGDKHYLNVLLALCEGEITSISDIQINDNPISNFDGVSVIQRLGTNNQETVPDFEDLHSVYSVGANLVQNDPYLYTTNDNDVESFEIHFRLNNGLYQQSSSSGDIQSWSVSYHVEYKAHSSGTYIDLGIQTISAKSRSTVRRVFRKTGLAAGKYDIRVTRVSENSTLQPLKQGDLSLFQMDEIKTDDLFYPNTALLGLKLLATEQLSGGMPNITAVVKGRKVPIPAIRYHEIPIPWEEYYWDGLNYRLFSNNALLEWNGDFEVAYSANPVWCLKDLLTNKRYGLGEFIANENLDDSLFLEMSQYCEEKVSDGAGGFEKRFRLDVVIDSNTKALDLLIQLCATFNAMPVYAAGGIAFKIDKPSSPVQLFGMGNIIKDSFTQSWKTLKEVPNVIEVQFTDRDKNYKQETIAYVDETAIASGEPVRKNQVRLFTTRASYALRAARYALKAARCINRSIILRTGIESVACQAGDIISVSHDVPQWGFSGRIAETNTASRIRLDREVLIEDGKSYKMQVRFADDAIEERLVTSHAGLYSEIECEPFASIPEGYDVYVIGEVNKVKKDFRIVSVKREEKNEVEITALEYNEAVYDDSDIIIPQNNFSSLSSEIPKVENLKLTEALIKKPDGTIEDAIDVWFDKSVYTDGQIKAFSKARIYLSDDNGLHWGARGETTNTGFRITGDIIDGHIYKVKVVSVADNGQENSLESAPASEITIVGKSAPPSDVTTFLVNQDRDRLFFGWAEIPDVDVWGYEIRWGADWDSGSVVTFQQGTHYLTTNFRTGIEQSYWIKAIDTSGNYSKNPRQAVITITNIPFRNIIAEFEDHPLWLGAKNNLLINGVNLTIAAGFMSGTYTAPVRDFGYLSTVYIGIDVVVSLYTGKRFNDDTTTRFDSSDSLRFSGTESPGLAMFEIRTSEDNVVWTPWQQYQAGDYLCRFFQVRLTLLRLNITDTVNCSSLKTHGDLPDIDDGGHSEITDAVQGKEIVFEKLYHEEPIVNVTVTGGNGIYPRFLSKSITGFRIQLLDGSGAARTGTFDWLAHGI